MLVSGIVLTAVCALLTCLPKSAAVILPVAVSVLLLCFFRKSRKFIIILVCCICTITAVITSFFFYKAKIEPCIPYHNTIASIEGKVISSPSTSDGVTVFTVETESIDYKEEKLKIEISVPEVMGENVSLYDIVFLENTEILIPLNDNGDYDFSSVSDGILLTGSPTDILYIKSAEKTPYYYCLKLKENIINKISVTMSNEGGGLLKGMLFGDKADISYETAESFRNSGIAHLLAVSGLHTSLWCGLLISLLSIFKVNEKARAIICLTFLGGFIIISAFTPSVIRSSLMTAVVLVAPLFKRHADSVNGLGLAVTVLLITNPYTVLSISFQLSAAATLGVLLSSVAQGKIFALTHNINIRQLRKGVNHILTNICVSLFASLFILPISAYHFGVFGILSPVSNILCVTLSFYGMTAGMVGIALSFIPVTVIKTVALVILHISEFIFDVVVTFSKGISSIWFCTVPVHKPWLLLALLICTILLLTGYVVYKAEGNKRRIFIKLTAAAVVLSLAVSILIPLAVPHHRNTITVVSSGDNIHLIIRSGTRYAYISNSAESLSTSISNYMPRATSEALRYYIPTYMTASALYDLEYYSTRYLPYEVRISEDINELCLKTGVSVPRNTVLKLQDKYYLSDEITFEIIDTYSTKYVIIEGNEKRVLIHLHGDTNLSDIPGIESFDIIVLNGSAAEYIPHRPESIIISADSHIITDPNLSYNQERCDNFYTTAQDGTIQLTV